MGKYLATHLTTKVVGLKDYTIPYVQGTNTIGYQLKVRKWTLIVARLRGGEPIARARANIKPYHKRYMRSPRPWIKLLKRDVTDVASILFVDSVLNIGKSMVVFVEHIRGINPQAKVLLVAGVVQAGAMAVDKEESLRRKMEVWGDVSNVALRVSENKYTGVKGTDTGDRLFNITHWALE